MPQKTTTWINMQDAFFQEKGKVGGWLEIGYSAPGTGASTSYSSNVFDYSPDGAGSADASEWHAKAKTKLNDCAIGEGWVLIASNGTEESSGSGTYVSFGIADGGSDGNCKNLTASWDNLTRASN